LHEVGADWNRMHYGFLSHEHTDHLLGMVWVMRYYAELMLYKDYQGDFTLFTHDVAAEKVIAVCKLLLKPALAALIGDRVKVQIVEDGDSVEINGDVYTFFDIHSTKAKQFGFRLDNKEGTSLVFLGDEPFAEECAKYVEPCDYMIHESFCLYSERHLWDPYELHHSTIREACLTGERFHAKHLIITHTEDFSTYGCKQERYTAEGKEYYTGDLIVPLDFDVIEFENDNTCTPKK
ncbi:MAG: MBL fold metallo-hydrolase, partial [Lachnospiraceae bacterium]|nr:MBL fold metallo-hydrolase [Candidatus Equihabitans merdae]